MHRAICFIIGCSFFVFAFSGCKSDHNTKTEPPNILLIMADDLGWGDVGYNGQSKIQTPVIDQLASDGMIFHQMYAGSSVCGPSRASLITGKHAGHGTVRGNPKWTLSGKPVDIDASEETIAETLKKIGYRTGIVGKWGLSENLGKTTPNKKGFDYFYGFNKHMPAHHYYPDSIWENEQHLRIAGNNTQLKQGQHVQELFTKKALEFLKTSDQDPFFLYLAYTTPHYELTIPDTFKKEYLKQQWPLRKMKPKHYLHDSNGHVTYAAMVSKMDADIGRIVEQLKKSGQYQNTLIIVTSDNGHEYDLLKTPFFDSNGPFRGRKRDLYEGGIRIPFSATWPKKITAGSATQHQAAFWDLKATFEEIAGVSHATQTDGISFAPTLLGDVNQSKHDYLYWEFNEARGPIQALRKGPWKLMHFVERSKYELYNLDRDISESNDISKHHPTVVHTLKKLMSRARSEHPEFPLTKRKNPWKK